jgi:hypothetical protein
MPVIIIPFKLTKTFWTTINGIDGTFAFCMCSDGDYVVAIDTKPISHLFLPLKIATKSGAIVGTAFYRTVGYPVIWSITLPYRPSRRRRLPLSPR